MVCEIWMRTMLCLSKCAHIRLSTTQTGDKKWDLGWEIHWLSSLETACFTDFLCPSLELWFAVWLQFYVGAICRNFVAVWAEAFYAPHWTSSWDKDLLHIVSIGASVSSNFSSVNPYPTAFPYGNGMVLHFYQQQESSTTKTVHKVINKGLKTYV